MWDALKISIRSTLPHLHYWYISLSVFDCAFCRLAACMHAWRFIFSWTAARQLLIPVTFKILNKPNERGIVFPRAAKTNCNVAERGRRCYLCPPAVAAACVGCQLPPQMSLPSSAVSGSQWLPLCLAATPPWCYATLGPSAFWVFFFLPPVCLRVRGAINKRRAFMVRVAHQGIAHAAWQCTLVKQENLDIK